MTTWEGSNCCSPLREYAGGRIKEKSMQEKEQKGQSENEG
jgi:hypothetical protein